MKLLSFAPLRIAFQNSVYVLDALKIHADKKKVKPTITTAPNTTGGEPMVPPQPKISTK